MIRLTTRGVIAVSGPDRVAFLQGLVTNDVTLAGPDRAVYAAFLTPQGKFLHDFILVAIDDAILLDCEAERRDDLVRRLKPYRLRAKVGLEDWSDRYGVAVDPTPDAVAAAGLSAQPGLAKRYDGGLVLVDPRHADLGARWVMPTAALPAEADPAALAAYDADRLALGIPDGSRDLIVERSPLLENNLDALNAIAWDKGCYLGQELTARTHYRALIKKRLVPVAVSGPMPPPGTPVTSDGRDAGEVRSGADGRALALLRLELLASGDAAPPLQAGPATLTPTVPGWLAPVLAAGPQKK